MVEQMGISAKLYVKIPFVGRLQLADLQGTLTTGTQVQVNLFLASGTVTLFAKPNASGRHDLYINLVLTIKYLKKYNTGDIKLFGLPYARFVDIFLPLV